jgi:hypothetical protein
LGYSVVWFQEEGQIKLFSPTGSLEQTCSLQAFCDSANSVDHRQQRRAA